IAAAETSDTKAMRLVRRSICSSRLFFSECGKPHAGWQGRPYSARRNELLRTARCGEYARYRPHSFEAGCLDVPKLRVGPRFPGLGALGFRIARWVTRKTMGRIGFNELDSDFARERLAHVRRKLARGETVYLAGIGLPGTHN